MSEQPNLSAKQQIVLELTKTLIANGHQDPAKQAIEYAETILKTDKPKIGFTNK